MTFSVMLHIVERIESLPTKMQKEIKKVEEERINKLIESNNSKGEIDNDIKS